MQGHIIFKEGIMHYNIQNDPKWKNVIMTKGPGWVDTLEVWGCLVTSLANIFQHIMQKSFTPKDMNDVITEAKAYYYLDNPGTPESVASVIVWEKIKQIFSGSCEINLRINAYKYRLIEGRFYIGKIKSQYSPTGSHYINVLHKSGNYFTTFDTYTGHVKIYHISKIQYLHEIVRKQ